jgi:alpha-glucosidase
MAISRRALIAGAGAAATGAVLASASTSHATEPAALARRAARPAALPIASRNSVWTRSGAGPLYWNIYGWAFPHNAPIPEAEWQANVDWLAKDFAPHGYRMACTDGWIEGSSRTTRNGYITTYNDSWQHDWAYWARYLKTRDMSLGVYYNPLWVHRAAVADPDKTVVGRPDVRIADIVTEGDFFAGGIGGDTLYWVDVTKDGAKEFVQGYVKYFKDLGVPYLRIDFLSWYEDGRDANIGTVGLPHGRANYETALRWMHEAAGEDIELSLVMPHLYHHAEAEVRYGDLIRINADADKGGWDRLSGGRQHWQDAWPNWHNPFLGFTGYADRSGRGQLILDGDFLMMNTFADDDERRTCISLMTLAGSPLTISDLHSNIADHGWAYTNPEVLALHHQGLVGKPYFHNATSYAVDPGSRDSERWAGQLPDGTWAVALFNRSDGPATRSLDLTALGIDGTARVRDLWRHQDLGRLSTVRADLPAHGTLLVKVTPDTTSRYQAAFAAWGGGAGFGNTVAGHEAMGYAHIGADGASVTFAVGARAAGTYRIALRYSSETGGTLTLGAEKPDHTVVTRPGKVDFPATGGSWATMSGTVKLAAGDNLITVVRAPGDTGTIALNHIDVR